LTPGDKSAIILEAKSSTPAAPASSTAHTATDALPPPEPLLNAEAAATPTPLPADEWQAAIDKLTETTASNITPHIGWLRELGLDFGWGPTSTMQFLIERVHIYSDMPWWGTILTLTIAVRVAMFPLYLKSSDTAGRLAVVQNHIKPIMARSAQARKTGDQALLMEAAGEMRAAYKAAGVKPLTMFVPMMLQIPLGYGSFRLLRNMAELPVPGLEKGGVMWFTDLTVADPYFILPVVTSGMTFLMFKV
jgi:YidC/Oxa1 family membrane protein insertase